jgi:hypothetical protein
MSVLVFADSSEGKFKKSAFEVVSYGKKVAEQLGSNVVAVTINVADASATATPMPLPMTRRASSRSSAMRSVWRQAPISISRPTSHTMSRLK